MKCMLLIGFALFASSYVYSAELLEIKVSLPAKEIIAARIEKLALPPCFDEITGFQKQLSEVHNFDDLLTKVVFSMNMYYLQVNQVKKVSKNDQKRIAVLMHSKGVPLLKALLQDDQGLLDKIQQHPDFLKKMS